MVHLRINEREPNPNPYINFITVLPTDDTAVEKATHQLLRALAAQVRPVMKAHGFVVNSLEEYEFNRVFAGRNWNNGETIELVLRSSTGSLLSAHWLMSTLCHELAHIKHMDHGSAFQTLWRQLQQEVRALQDKGYYGDGYWSSGTRLADSAKITGQAIEMGELPEYMCGGAHPKARRVSRRPPKSKDFQAVKKRKAGSRVTSSAFNSIGITLNQDLEGETKLHGIGFRKKAGSKRAREERALAAEQRVQTLASNLSTPPVHEGDVELEDVKQDPETDRDRRRKLLEVIEEKDLAALRATMLESAHDFLPQNVGSTSQCGPHDIKDRYVSCSGRFSGSNASPNAETPAHQRKKRKTSLPGHILSPNNTPVTHPGETTTKRNNMWNCEVCTLTNEPNHLACSACSTPRGETRWIGDD